MNLPVYNHDARACSLVEGAEEALQAYSSVVFGPVINLPDLAKLD